ncbi:MAG: glutaredoxin domain-containing protein [Candidatus Pacebacteria bacterium]|nr:glutaredoxin domain-containing protein [Candidatus Paceibacterota bacterium]
MKQNQKIVVSSILFLLIMFFGASTVYKEEKQAVAGVSGSVKEDSDIILFYGVTCPHCKNVEAYLEENGVAERVDFAMKEVYLDKGNAALLAEKAKACGRTGSIGVPFLWNDGECISGDTKIIEFFKNRISEE